MLTSHRLPEMYWELKLPHKLPPAKEVLPVLNLPMLGFLEQTVASSLVKSLTAVGNFKPKYPFLSPSRSSLIYLAYYLKGKLHCLLILISVKLISMFQSDNFN